MGSSVQEHNYFLGGEGCWVLKAPPLGLNGLIKCQVDNWPKPDLN